MKRVVPMYLIALALGMFMGLPQYHQIDWNNKSIAESDIFSVSPFPSKAYGSTSGRGHNWTIQTVDSIGIVGEYSSIELDSTNNPHISYYNSSDRSLKYAYWDGANWYIGTVDSDGIIGKYTALALDTNNSPHISYYDSDNALLKYAFYNGIEWQIDTIDSCIETSSIAVDTNNHPHINYCTGSGNLGYAHFNGISWNTETVDPIALGAFSSIALDNNQPHVSYSSGYPNCDLKYAYYDGNQWQNEIVDSHSNVGNFTSLALDSNGYPHIGYQNWSSYDLKYAYWDGAIWHNETVDFDGWTGWEISLALDTNNHPHICYYDFSDWDLKYSYWNGEIWLIETVVSSGRYPSLELDSDNHSHISYCDGTSYDLKYATTRSFQRPIADAGPDQTIERGNTITFNGSGSSGDEEIINYTWTLTDLGYKELFGVAPTYIFNNVGTFEITLNVTDSQGQWDMDTTTITVNDTSPPSAPILHLATNRTKFEQLWVEGRVPRDCAVKVMVNYERTYTETPDAEGNFTFAVLLDPGENVVTAYAIDRFNRSSPFTIPQIVMLDNEAPYVTDIFPERNRTGVPIDTDILVEFNEPLSDVDIILWYFDEEAREWKQAVGETRYESWSLFANFIPSETLLKETKYKMEVDMTDTCRRNEGDTAGNSAREYLYSKQSVESYTFITEIKEHQNHETNYVIKSQVINITYGKMGKTPLSRPELLRPISEEPAPPPEGNLSLGVYFEVTFKESVTFAKVTFRYYLNAHQLDHKLRNPELWDIDNISFYMLSGEAWEKLATVKLFDESTVCFYINNPGNVTITLGIFAPDLDWDDDGVPNSEDPFPEAPDNYMDSDGDGVIDDNDPYPNNPLYKADTDNDGIPDSWESLYDLSPTDPSDGDDDADNDGLSNANEFEQGTSPNDPDSDGDGMPDGWEVDYKLDPRDASDKDDDADNDGLTNFEEYGRGTNPFIADPAPEREDKSTGGRSVYWLVLGVILGLLMIGIIVFVAVRANRNNRGLEGEGADMDISGEDEFGRVEGIESGNNDGEKSSK